MLMILQQNLQQNHVTYLLTLTIGRQGQQQQTGSVLILIFVPVKRVRALDIPPT